MNNFEIPKIEDALKISSDFSDEEKELLKEHYKNKNLNLFYLVIIEKVLTQRKFKLDNSQIIPGLLSFLTDFNIEHLPINVHENIIDRANTLYKILMVLDIKDIDSTEF